MYLVLQAFAIATVAVLGAWLMWRVARGLPARLSALWKSAIFKRYTGRIAAGVLALAALQFASYALWAERRISFTLDRFLPQHTHFSDGTEFRFACVSEQLLQRLSDRNQRELQQHLLRWFPTVFLGEQTIPAGHKEEVTDVSTGKRRMRNLNSGCLLTMEVKKKGLMWFQAVYADWEGALAAGSHEGTFVWILGRWWAIDRKRGPMS